MWQLMADIQYLVPVSQEQFDLRDFEQQKEIAERYAYRDSLGITQITETDLHVRSTAFYTHESREVIETYMNSALVLRYKDWQMNWLGDVGAEYTEQWQEI